jgi:uncharacterized membrane protein YfcA
VALLLLVVTAFLAGAINAIAGGGTLLTFPALLAAGAPPIVANATSTVALVPGSFGAFWAYRRELGDARRDLLWFGAPSVVGGLLGALLVVRVGDVTFGALVPWLIFGATALFAVQPVVRRWLDRRRVDRLGRNDPAPDPAAPGRAAPGRAASEGRTAFGFVAQFLTALYGGFFGAGIGILMLAAMGLSGLRGMNRMNGLKNFAAICINGVAAVTFVLLGRVRWSFAIVMAIAAVVGGYLGGDLAKRIGDKQVRRVVIAIGVANGLLVLLRR